MQKKLTLIGFDSWTGGISHFSRLIPALSKKNIGFTLVHLSSWNEKYEFEKEKIIDGVLTRDISFYGSNSFRNILEIEKPDAVIFLSTDVFAHRAFIRYCDLKKIPTLNLYHGLIGVLDISSPNRAARPGKNLLIM